MIYFDNASTTFIEDRVKNVMIETMHNIYGNPSGKYYKQALNSKKLIEDNRAKIAKYLNVVPDEIVFNSGASEGNNHVLKGIGLEEKNIHIITSELEHNSTLSACRDLEELGIEVTYLKSSKLGVISLEDFKSKIKNNTRLVSIIWGNNEIGSLNDIVSISKICKINNIMLHVDGTQVIGKLPIDLKKLNIDFFTFSGHKIYGPKGVGVLFIKQDEYGLSPDMKSLISGSQEGDRRGGTQAIHNIAGLGEAIDIVSETQKKYYQHLYDLEKYFMEKLLELKVTINGYNKNSKIPGIINFQLQNTNNEIFIKENSDNIAVSTGSACSLSKPSHVLKGIGIDKFKIMKSIRVSLGKENTKDEIDEFIKILKKYV